MTETVNIERVFEEDQKDSLIKVERWKLIQEQFHQKYNYRAGINRQSKDEFIKGIGQKNKEAVNDSQIT